jgi:hypothetical protein
VGPFDANLARPGDRSASFLHFWLGSNIERIFNLIVVFQVGVVLYHIFSAVSKAHYIADLFMALLNYPFILVILWWRREALHTLKK